MKKYLVFLMAALMLVALAVAGCGGSKDEAKAQPEKVLRVATEPTFALNSRRKAAMNWQVLIWI